MPQFRVPHALSQVPVHQPVHEPFAQAAASAKIGVENQVVDEVLAPAEQAGRLRNSLCSKRVMARSLRGMNQLALRCMTVTRAAVSASCGTICTALAALPTMTARFPLQSYS